MYICGRCKAGFDKSVYLAEKAKAALDAANMTFEEADKATSTSSGGGGGSSNSRYSSNSSNSSSNRGCYHRRHLLPLQQAPQPSLVLWPSKKQKREEEIRRDEPRRLLASRCVLLNWKRGIGEGEGLRGGTEGFADDAVKLRPNLTRAQRLREEAEMREKEAKGGGAHCRRRSPAQEASPSEIEGRIEKGAFRRGAWSRGYPHPGHALRKVELLQELEERKAVKDAQLHQKRGRGGDPRLSTSQRETSRCRRCRKAAVQPHTGPAVIARKGKREEKRKQRKAAREALNAAQTAFDKANAAVKAVVQERNLYLKELLAEALRKTELLKDLEELKEIKDERLEQKRQLEQTIAGLNEELQAEDAAFREAKTRIAEVVRKLNKEVEDQRLHQKRELEDEIRGLQAEADAAFR
ncbi:hypothetical protein CNMCM5623_008411 [Aspergillus felis]|uniref:Uncharacterized protein n=1 Tax=Aspergillus felis TaxID=1287682 RepID=A0A8H6Q063_9EURO|nr:hypothetical protein CNMCM5623_008411 [Aspergillus felis]